MPHTLVEVGTQHFSNKPIEGHNVFVHLRQSGWEDCCDKYFGTRAELSYLLNLQVENVNQLVDFILSSKVIYPEVIGTTHDDNVAVSNAATGVNQTDSTCLNSFTRERLAHSTSTTTELDCFGVGISKYDGASFEFVADCSKGNGKSSVRGRPRVVLGFLGGPDSMLIPCL